MNNITALSLAAVMFTSGCATIVGDKTQHIQVDSNPSGATFSIKDELGRVVAQGKTPQDVILEKSDGSYFGKKGYLVSFTKENSESVTLPIKASANGWYIGGNFIFGSLIGWLLCDPFNGGMYTLHPKAVIAELPQTQKAVNAEVTQKPVNAGTSQNQVTNTIILMLDPNKTLDPNKISDLNKQVTR